MKKALPFIILLFLSITVLSQTNIPGGIISGTWTAAGSPYLVQGNVLVADGTTLTIEPGVTVSFQGNFKLLVSGRLIAAGTAADSIRFSTSNTATGWQGIRFDNTPATNDSSIISYCSIGYVFNRNVNGGGIFIRNFSKISVRNNAVSNCMVSAGYGGGIYLESSDVTITNNTITNNHAVSGGGIFVAGGNPKLLNNIISYNDNQQPPAGGIGDPGPDPDSYGGGIDIRGGAAIVTGNIITYNTCFYGGGMMIEMGSPSVSNNDISNNMAMDGGGINCRGGGSYTGNTIANNVASVRGGGIRCENNAIFSNNKIIYNTAAYAGGGISVQTPVVTISNNLIANNSLTSLPTVEYDGGGGMHFLTSDTTTVISGNVIVNNTGINGGAFLFDGAKPKLINNTIINNSASKGGALYCYNSSPVLLNTIVWGNTATAAGAGIFLSTDISDPTITFCNISGGVASIDPNGNFYTGTYQNNINADPLFTAPSSGSGSSFDGVTANWNISNGSPCINAGKPNTVYPASDYAGNVRVVNGIVDIGAIENQTPIPPTAAVSGGGTVCLGTPRPSVIFTFTYGTPPFKLQYSINGITQPAVTGITGLQYTIANAPAGNYAIVSVSDTLTTGTGSGAATVNVVAPVADFTVNDSTQCLAGNLFIFTNTSVSNGGSSIAGWSWDFGDGTTFTGVNPTHRYNSAGTFAVRLAVVTANGCTDTITKIITVTSFSINPLADTVRTFSDSVILNAGAGYAGYQWNTGAVTQTITVKNTGLYKVTVTNGAGCTDSDSSYVDLRRNKTLFIDQRTNLCSVSSVALAVRAKNITNIVGLQGTLRWNQSVLTLDSIIYNNNPVDFGPSDINLTNKTNGYITYTWSDNTLAGQTVPDSTVLFTMQFSKLSPSPATSQFISFSNTPTTLEIDSINQQTHTPVIVTETAYVNGLASFRASAVNTQAQLTGCGSVVYNNVTYYDSTSVYDTLKFAGSQCDSLVRTVIIAVYHNAVTPTISISPATVDILTGSSVSFTAFTTYAGNAAVIEWYVNGTLVQSGATNTYTTTSLKGGDSVYAVLRSSLSCASAPQITSGTVIANVRYLLGGSINYVTGVGVRQPSVKISESASGNITFTASLNGTYSLLPYGGPSKNYIIMPFKTNDVNKTNGVSTLDIAIIQNHILNTALFTSPYQWIAADVNHNHAVTSLDILLIKRLILGLDNTFPGNSLWTFVDTTGGAFNPSAPFNYRDSVILNGLLANTVVNFTGIKLGDVNFDYNNLLTRPQPSSAIPVVLYYDNLLTKKGAQVRVPVRVKNAKDILGMQFTINFNQSALEFRGIEHNMLSMNVATNRSSSGNLSFIWNDPNNKPANLNDGDLLMELVFAVKESFTEEDIAVTSDITVAEMWDAAFKKHDIVKGAGKISAATGNDIGFNTESIAISPNPTSGPVTIDLKVVKNKNITILLVDEEGKTVFTKTVAAQKGVNYFSINMNGKNTIAPGTYYTRTIGLDDTTSKKIVIVK